MRHPEDNNDLFHASQLTILLTYTIFSVILIAESLLMSWEIWPLLLVALGVFVCWILHIQQRFSERGRLWVYSIFIMFAFFFYGSHWTSVFDTVAVMSVVIILFTMTGIPTLITFLQILYYITFGYGLVSMIKAGETLDALIISRAVLHIAVVTTVSQIARLIINKWRQVINRSRDEIDQLTDATNRLNDFLANVSHEIRTPVNAVIGLTGICIEEEQNPEITANLVSVRNAGRRVADQIGDILDYSEIDSGRLTNNYENYMIASLLTDIVAELRPYKPDHLELIIDIDPAIPAVLNSDVNKLGKILRHLIMNGLKYTAEGGVYVRVSVEKEDYGVNLIIEVTDTGIGMDEEESERIFDGFYQADSGRARSQGGLGLGLSIISGFVSALGGFVVVNSKPGKGTSVRVSVPQKVVDQNSCMSVRDRDSLCLAAFLHFEKFPNPSVRDYYNSTVRNIVSGLGVQMHRVDSAQDLTKLAASVRLSHLFVGDDEYLSASADIERLASDVVVVVVADEDFRLPEGSKARIMEKPFYCFPVVSVLNSDVRNKRSEEGAMYCKGVRALVVDDEPMNLSVARSIFKRYGMTVSTAASGPDAIDLCKNKEYDIVFMDHMMPGMDGVEAMKQIRGLRNGNIGEVPIVALTANAVSSAKEMFMSVGFDGFVSKPIEIPELERVLKKVLPKSAISYESADAITDHHAEQKKEEMREASLSDRLSAAGIDAALGLEYCQNDAELYDSLLKQFVAEYAEKSGKLEEYEEKRDLKNYEIYAHALKTTARMIGNTGLSVRARDLENAAREGNDGFVSDNHEDMMQAYQNTVVYIAEVLDIDMDSNAGGEAPDDIMEFDPDPDDEIMVFEPVKRAEQ